MRRCFVCRLAKLFRHLYVLKKKKGLDSSPGMDNSEPSISNRLLLEKMIVAHLVKKLPNFGIVK